MTNTAIEEPAAGRVVPGLPVVRRVLRNLSVGTLSLLVLAAAGFYVMTPPAEAFALSASAETAAPSGVPVVYGKVRDRFGHPLTATVRVRTRDRKPAVVTTVTTEPDGTYRIELPGRGRYQLTVSTRHVSGHRNFRIRRVSALRIDAVLVRRGRFSIGPISSY